MKTSVLLFFTLLVAGAALSQTSEQNCMKYWKHREQLSQFVYKGENVNPSTVHGSYLVAAFKRTWAHCFRDFEFGNTKGNGLLDSLQYDQKCNGLKFGADATIQLCWYIGVLATEYRLLTNHSASTFEVERELWGALKAYERLDLMAETLYDEGEPQLNGFFLRDDIMPFFASDKLKPDGLRRPQAASYKPQAEEPWLKGRGFYLWRVRARMSIFGSESVEPEDMRAPRGSYPQSQTAAIFCRTSGPVEHLIGRGGGIVY